MHNIAHKTDKHTSRFVWGYLNPRIRTDIYFEQTGICLFGAILGNLNHVELWSSCSCFATSVDLIFVSPKHGGEWKFSVIGAGPGRLPTYLTRRIQAQRSSDFRMKIFHSFFHCDYKEIENNIEISRRPHLAISCLVAASFLSFQAVGNGGL